MVAYDENLMKIYITTILKPLTLHPASAPPPPHTMVVFTVLPHQSLLVQVEWPTRGRYACFSWADRGPPAATKKKGGCGKRMFYNQTSGTGRTTNVSGVQPTGGASPSGDVAEIVVGQDLSRWGQSGQLDVGVELGIGGQTQQGNVVSEVESKGEDFFKRFHSPQCFQRVAFLLRFHNFEQKKGNHSYPPATFPEFQPE